MTRTRDENRNCIDAILRSHFKSLTHWERKFLKSIKHQFKNLSPKQSSILERIWKQTFGPHASMTPWGPSKRKVSQKQALETLARAKEMARPKVPDKSSLEPYKPIVLRPEPEPEKFIKSLPELK